MFRSAVCTFRTAEYTFPTAERTYRSGERKTNRGFTLIYNSLNDIYWIAWVKKTIISVQYMQQ